MSDNLPQPPRNPVPPQGGGPQQRRQEQPFFPPARPQVPVNPMQPGQISGNPPVPAWRPGPQTVHPRVLPSRSAVRRGLVSPQGQPVPNPAQNVPNQPFPAANRGIPTVPRAPMAPMAPTVPAAPAVPVPPAATIPPAMTAPAAPATPAAPAVPTAPAAPVVPAVPTPQPARSGQPQPVPSTPIGAGAPPVAPDEEIDETETAAWRTELAAAAAQNEFEQVEAPESLNPEPAPTEPPAKRPGTWKRLSHLRDQSRTLAKTGVPNPPPSTLRANLIGILTGLLVAPLAMIFLIWGTKTVMDASYGAGAVAIFLGIFEILAGTALLSITGVITGYYSSLSWAISALWPVLLTVLASPIRGLVASHNDTLTGASQYSLWWDFLDGVSTLTASGLFPTMAIVMVGASLAAQIAYLEGRDFALLEHQLGETNDREPGTPIAPPSRLKYHLRAIVVSVVCTVAGMLSLIPLHDRLAVITGASGHLSKLPAVATYGLPILGILLLFIAVYSGSRSAAGLMFAGVTCGVIPGAILAFGEASTSGWAERLVRMLSDYLTASMHVSGGPLMTFGFVLIACALTLWWCRQSGVRDQKADLEAGA
ncbi:hypothetical protein [Mobiluncus curtisii]|uniref:hypothetical protein n=1 Tax=Mobiluncus curtisii TaxID=2051 RepID=UPI0001E09515|nr:hypothetical protein [Mobiluncus curtisii]EFL93424.1 hypothetical protein HMPREF0574_1154 [Mobiluncus curtisii subsp. curtisii ATCC 35241]NMW89724.1 hypothetical protein [Mobiluncus curtisii]QQT12438.1 hypothetical protein I6I84_04645 [Mobiluncus curtisii]